MACAKCITYKAESVLAGFFHSIHGFIGLLDKLIHICIIVGVKRDPDACADGRLPICVFFRASSNRRIAQLHSHDATG